MSYIFWIGGIIIAMRIAKSKNRNTHTWGAIALFVPVIAILIILCLGSNKIKKNDNLIDDSLD